MSDGVTRKGVRGIDPQTSQPVDVDPAEAAERFVAGRLQLIKALEYPMRTADGAVWAVPADEVAEALRNGAAFASQSEVTREEAKSTEGAIQATAEGAMRPFGGDAILVQMGVDREGIQARKDEHPVKAGIAGAATVAGVAALTGGGAGALAARGLQMAAGEQLAAHAAGRVAAYGVGSALEGAVVGAGTGLSEATLGNSEDVAEHVLASAGAGALLSGLIGAGVRGAGAGFRAVVDRGRARLRDFAGAQSAAAGAVEDTLARAKQLRADANAAAAELKSLGGVAAEVRAAELEAQAVAAERAAAGVGTAAPAGLRGLARLAISVPARAAGRVLGVPGAVTGLAGDAAADALLARAKQSNIAALHRAVAETGAAIDSAAGRLVGAVDRGSARVGRAAPLAPLTASMISGDETERDVAFRRRAAEVTAMGTNPGAVSDAWGAHTAPLNAVAPEATGVLQGRMVAALEYLRSRLPKSVNPDPMAEGADAILVPEAARHEFALVDAALQDPLRVLRPDATSAEIDAVAAVYPRLHSTMQRGIAKAVGPATPWEARQRLAAGWGVATHAALEPAALTVLQRRYAPKPPGPGQPRKPKGREPMAGLSEADRLTYKP